MSAAAGCRRAHQCALPSPAARYLPRRYQPTATTRYCGLLTEDVRGLSGIIVVREAVLQAVDSVGVPELGVVVRRGGPKEVGRVRLLRDRQLRNLPVEPGAQRGLAVSVQPKICAVDSLVSPTEAP